MLRFDRESFKSGVMLVKEPDPAHPGEFLKYMLRPQQKGDDFTFVDESYILAHYPGCFTVTP